MTQQSSQGQSGQGDPRQSRLAALLADYMDRFNAGETIDEDEIRRAHSDLAAELINDLRTLRQVGSKADGGDHGALGDYRLIRRIGRGGMGVVYEAWQNSMDRRVALKVLPAGLAADDRAFHRFMREAKTAGKLNHQNVVSVFGLGIEANTPYFAMEFVDGESLAQVLARVKGSPPEASTPFGFPRDDVAYYSALARCFAEVAEGLQHAHSKGVIHRDIKPSNLILDREGRLRILDFGLARLEGQESLTLTGDFLGTVLYMSPEQAMARRIPIDHRTDIYSLGATMYELLALKPPFQGKNLQDTLSQIIVRDPPPLRHKNPGIPRDLETIVLKCLRKDPGGRFNTAEALAQDLRRFVRGDPIEARPSSRWEASARKAWRNRGKIAIATVIGILLVISSILGLLHHRQRLVRELALYEEAVVRSMLRVEMSAVPNAASTRLITGTFFPGWLLHLSDFEGTGEDLRKSLDELRLQARTFPDRPEAYYQHARVLLALERTEEAVLELERALRADPAFLPARFTLENLGGVPKGRHPDSPTTRRKGPEDWRDAWADAHEAMRRSDHAWAIDCASRLLDGLRLKEAYCGAEIEARLLRAEARLRRKDIRAVADLEVVRSRWPLTPEPILLQGFALHQLGHPEEAEAVFQQVLETFPQKGTTSLWVAGNYIALDEHDRAERWIERVEHESARERLRAWRLKAIGDYSGAIAAAQRAIDLDPRNPRNYWVSGGIFDLRDTDKQAEILEKALEQFPDNLDLMDVLCLVRFRQGRYEEGIDLAKKVLRASPRMAHPRDMLGCCLFRLGRIDEALAALEEAGRSPGWDPADLGWANFNLGRLDEAREAYLSSNRLVPTSAWPLRLLGMIEARRGGWEEALNFLKRSLDAFPKNGVPEYNLAVFHEERGDLQASLQYLAESYRLAARGFPHWRLLNILRSPGLEKLDLTVLDGLAVDLERSTSPPEAVWEKQLLARILLLRGRNPDDAHRALDLARHALERAKRPYPEIHATVADAQFAAGEKTAAFRSLEHALLLQHATVGMAEQLKGWRLGSLPEVLTFGSLDDLAPEAITAPHASPTYASSLIERYHNGLIALEDGRFEEAAGVFAALKEEAVDEPGPWLRLAEAKRLAGAFRESLDAAIRGRAAFLGDARFQGELAILWSQNREAVEEELARAAAGEEDRRSSGAAKLLATLRELEETGGVGVDCGGLGFTDRSGRIWSVDAFYRGGWDHRKFGLDHLVVWNAYGDNATDPTIKSFWFHDRIQGTDEVEIYRTDRWFHPSEYRPGYRIPLPPGNYLVRLHFAEIWYRAEGLRRFDVLLEGKKVIEGIEPFIRGFAVAFVEERETRVDDGLLDVEFKPDRGYPTISAIEVLRKD